MFLPFSLQNPKNRIFLSNIETQFSRIHSFRNKKKTQKNILIKMILYFSIFAYVVGSRLVFYEDNTGFLCTWESGWCNGWYNRDQTNDKYYTKDMVRIHFFLLWEFI